MFFALRAIARFIKSIFDALSPGRPLTTHARERMAQRGISQDQIRLVLNYGVKKAQRDKGSISYSARKSDVKANPSLRGCEDIVVITAADTGVIITAYHRDYSGRR